MDIHSSLKLPCGAVLDNRLAKAAMTERFSDSDLKPNQKHYTLYEKWAKDGSGLLITGNVLLDSSHLESAGNVVMNEVSMPELKLWAAAATANGNHCWTQISHSGRQTSIFNNLRPVSASNVKLKKLGFFAKPRTLLEDEILQLIEQFAEASRISKEAGFTGVQIHAAHGYLISQFLSPNTNLRTDSWGGSLENRTRILFEIIRRTRAKVGSNFPISVKLNSSDFQKGGFSEEDSLWVIKKLDELGVDLLEISGGTYENAEFLLAENVRQSTKNREAYFLDFAEKVRKQSSIPLMVTGGIRTLSFCNTALQEGLLDVVGMARPYLLYDDFAKRFLSEELTPEPFTIRTGIKAFEDMAEAGFYNLQLDRLGRGGSVYLGYSPARSAFHLVKHEFVKAMANKLRG
ncbi:2,4-dienoyl-CoA reductase [Reichenbachiella faecimaris]|uniref:2,4-dienoyl-CoA reductase n=1 Tax=Reichenbachiella faecimaris TaxID=692418 RepID=A0A1W2GHH1_REIFA|nr:NADH:flavin oxidoreductase/NADH oxidase family protein [Reichenbachiella faecimaris]SMD36105.1 2,4-dienoyl-CoA reductase [Reichenbachiella faecimaris]